jgi:hypothetical protein
MAEQLTKADSNDASQFRVEKTSYAWHYWKQDNLGKELAEG